jgi:hypothetical protein
LVFKAIYTHALDILESREWFNLYNNQLWGRYQGFMATPIYRLFAITDGSFVF